MKIGIIGLGLIGGSMAKAIKEKTDHAVFGFDTNPETMFLASMTGAMDGALDDEKLAECGLKGADKLGFDLSVNLFPSVGISNIAANIGIEKQRICDSVGINAAAADGYINIKVDFAVNNSEGDGIGGAEFIIYKLFGVEIINSLVFAGIAAVSEPFAYNFEGFLDGILEIAGEYAGLS